MNFYTLNCEKVKNIELSEEFNSAHKAGIVSVGDKNLFFKKGFKHFFIPFNEISRVFRRAMLVPSKVSKSGSIQLENLVICKGDKEVAVLGIPGTNAAVSLMDELKMKMPNIEFTCPDRRETNEQS